MGYLVSHAYYVGGRMYRDMAHYGLNTIASGSRSVNFRMSERKN